MKAAQINAYGGSEVVKINTNVVDPALSAGKVFIEIYAAGVNPADWKIREGYMQKMAPLQFPVTLGGDFSGIVKKVGEGVSDFKNGDEIYGQASVLGGGSGSFAEFALANANTIAHKPKRVNHVEAAALPLAGVSALQGLIDHIKLRKGQKILIHGGAGGIGTFAIQIAKYLGAYVATTVSAEDVGYVKELGANEVINYKTQHFEDLLKDYDAVFDTVGEETYERSFKILKKGGIIVSMLEQPHQDLTEQHGVKAIAEYAQVTNEHLSKLSELVDKGIIRVHVDETLPLEQATEALTHLQTKHVKGKVVLKIK